MLHCPEDDDRPGKTEVRKDDLEALLAECTRLRAELADLRSVLAAHRDEVSKRLGDLLDNFAEESQGITFHEMADDGIADAEDCCDGDEATHETEAGRIRAQIVALAFGPDPLTTPAPPTKAASNPDDFEHFTDYLRAVDPAFREHADRVLDEVSGTPAPPGAAADEEA